MKFSTFKWVEYADNGFINRNKVISVNELYERLKANNWGKNHNIKDWFVSICRFDDSFRRYRDSHVNKHGNPTVEGYEGLHIIDYAILEIDHQEGINGSINFSGDIVKHLSENFGLDHESDLVKDASGHKGFHFEIPAGFFQPEPHLKLFKIHRLFVESLFPKEWLKHGDLIDLNSYQINRLLRLRGTRNKEFGFKVSLNGSFAKLKDQPELIYEYWKAPTDECVGKEFITGEWYWNFQPKQNLAELWQKAQEQVENEGKLRVFIPASQRGKFSKAKLDKMPACVKNIHERMSENIRGDGLFNISVCALTLYYLYAGYSAEAAKRIVRGLTQPTTKSKEELEEIEKSMDSMIDQDGQPKYPWTCGKEAFPHLENFCANGELKNCPSVCEHTEKTHTQLMGIGDAFDNKVRLLKQGKDPYSLGIGPLDDFMGYVRLGSGMVVQAAPTVGKTAFMEKILKHQAAIAKPRDEQILWIPPEDDPEDTAEHIMMQRGKMTINQLIDRAQGIGFSDKFCEWFHEYNNTIKIWSVRDFTVKEIAAAIDAAESTFKRKVSVFFYDGVAFLNSANADRIIEAGIAQEMNSLIRFKKTRGIFSVHPKKIDDDEKTGMKAVNKRLGMYGAYGSMKFAALGRTVISLWKQDDYTMMVGAEKAKDRPDGKIEMIQPFPLVFDRYFSLWEQDEALSMSVTDFGRDPRMSFIKKPKEFSGL